MLTIELQKFACWRIELPSRALCILMSSDLHGASGDPSMEELILARSMIKMEFGNADESAKESMKRVRIKLN